MKTLGDETTNHNPKLQVFMCGNPRDHKCDDYGPFLYGGPEVETTSDREKAGKGYTWGSVSCSICGITAAERSYWELG